MNTETRSKILSLIDEKGEIRPADLRSTLGLSGAAIHRQLLRLVRDGFIERRGSAPRTTYAMAGKPDFTSLFSWLQADRLEHNPPAVSERRDMVAARLPDLKDFVPPRLSQSLLPLIIAVVGEIANNSFDHNLGLWRDVPGCYFEGQITGKQLWICIADRGQGILRSLRNVLPSLPDDQTALEAAFNQPISGRAPEKRGNGLKFVKANLTGAVGRGVACCSGNGVVSYGDQAARCRALLRQYVDVVKGTVTLLLWELA